jgi:hypothetical protein
MLHFRLKDGPVTVARFDGDFGEYRLAVGEGRTIDGPATLNNYLWMRDNWTHWSAPLSKGCTSITAQWLTATMPMHCCRHARSSRACSQ